MPRLAGGIRSASIITLLALLGLAGCSTTDTFEQPAPVPEVEASVAFKQVWGMSVGDGHDGELLYLSPLNAGDVIYAASADGELVAVSTDNGSLIWERELDDRLFAGVGGDQDRLYLITREAELVALARSDGHELWRASLPTEVLSAPQSNGSMVVTQTIDGRVLAFDSGDGHALWQYDGVVPVLSIRAAAAPLVGSDIVIAAFASGKLIALAADSGQPVWQYELGQPQGRTELERLGGHRRPAAGTGFRPAGGRLPGQAGLGGHPYRTGNLEQEGLQPVCAVRGGQRHLPGVGQWRSGGPAWQRPS